MKIHLPLKSHTLAAARSVQLEREGIRAPSEALKETECEHPFLAPTDTKVSPIPSSNCFAITLLV
jgi:hypothetical protein